MSYQWTLGVLTSISNKVPTCSVKREKDSLNGTTKHGILLESILAQTLLLNWRRVSLIGRDSRIDFYSKFQTHFVANNRIKIRYADNRCGRRIEQVE